MSGKRLLQLLVLVSIIFFTVVWFTFFVFHDIVDNGLYQPSSIIQILWMTYPFFVFVVLFIMLAIAYDIKDQKQRLRKYKQFFFLMLLFLIIIPNVYGAFLDFYYCEPGGFLGRIPDCNQRGIIGMLFFVFVTFILDILRGEVLLPFIITSFLTALLLK